MDEFTTLVGPLWGRLDVGAKRCAFLAEQKHLNRYGGVHGGCCGQGVQHESLGGVWTPPHRHGSARSAVRGQRDVIQLG